MSDGKSDFLDLLYGMFAVQGNCVKCLNLQVHILGTKESYMRCCARNYKCTFSPVLYVQYLQFNTFPSLAEVSVILQSSDNSYFQ